MSIDVWWPELRPGTRDWLIANNSDTVLPDAATDWIEQIANDERPGVE